MPGPAFTPPVTRGNGPSGRLVHGLLVPTTAAALALAACGDATRPGSNSDVVIDTIGDTVVVRTVSGSVWESTATLVPEVSIGELDGADEYLFGRIASIAVDDDHTVYVLDGQAQEVRVFDAGGTYVRTLGRPGEGPGEFTRAEAVAVLPDGRILVRDAGDKNIQVFGPGQDDTDQWPYSLSSVTSYTNTPLHTDNDGRTYQEISRVDEASSGSWPSLIDEIVVLGPDGTHLDTLPDPWGDYEPPALQWEFTRSAIPFSPLGHWSVHPSGHLLSGFPSDYTISLGRDDGVLRIERVYEPVHISEEERSYYTDAISRQQREQYAGWRWNGPPVPETKPVFRELMAGRNGRIWVSLETESYTVENERHDPDDPASSPVHWGSGLRYDVFEPDGTYLGTVDPPTGFSRYPTPVFDGDHVWAATRDELGVGRVVRYRIEVGEAPEG